MLLLTRRGLALVASAAIHSWSRHDGPSFSSAISTILAVTKRRASRRTENPPKSPSPSKSIQLNTLTLLVEMVEKHFDFETSTPFVCGDPVGPTPMTATR